MSFPWGAAIPRRFLASLLLALAAFPVAATEVYLEPTDFVAAAFSGATPQVRVLWLTPPLRAEATRILGHEPAQLRQKYWSDGHKSAWILEEIGKEDPITAGFIVNDNRIEQARVLIFRESRGGEIRYPSFVAQFRNTTLAGDGRLNREIDGIAGATLSVNAMVRMSRLALYFAQQAGK